MMPGWIKTVPLLAMFLMASLMACTTPTEKPALMESNPLVDVPSVSNTLSAPYAQQPASGICASFDGAVVTITINPDIPDPRCAKVKPNQKLTVLNNSQIPLQVTIGRLTASLAPGEKTIFDTPFGEYLAPGVHQLQVSPCCGAELWLEATK